MVSLDMIFELLREERRRYPLYYLDQQHRPVPVDELTEQVVEWEANPGTASVPEETVDRIRIELLHEDLPKAAEARYVQYDRESETVELTEPSPDFEVVVAVARVIERPDRNP